MGIYDRDYQRGNYGPQPGFNLAGPSSLFVARDRLEGYHRGLTAAGIEPDDALVIHTSFDREGGALGIDTLQRNLALVRREQRIDFRI